AAPPAAAAAAPAASDKVNSADVFYAIGEHIAKHPELVGQVATTFLFKLANPSSAYLIDLKSGKGSVTEGEGAADCTLTMEDSDWLLMADGKADPQKLYFGGKLKISGNVMASQKLTTLMKGMDPAAAKESIAKRRGAGGGAPAAAPAAAAAAPAAAGGVTSGDVFFAIGEHIAKHPELVAQVGTTFLFKLSNPSSAYLIDLKTGKGAVSEGEGAADCTLTMEDSDWLAMADGKADPQKLYFGGKLKIGGNVMASQKLTTLMKGMDPAAAKEAIAKRAAAGGGAKAPAAAASAGGAGGASGAKAAGIFKALAERIAQTPGLVSEVEAVIQFKVTDPDGAWVVDLKNGGGAVRDGSDAKADTTLTIADEDLVLLAKGHDTKDLYMRGKLRVDGAMRPAHSLGFMKGLA
ncbi:MAG: SCP2 sterol-binding domain-containing protein, partial [Deltaproteobacteria bacterium]